MKNSHNRLKKIISTAMVSMVLSGVLTTTAIASEGETKDLINSCSYDSVTGVTTLVVNVSGVTKTYLVAERGVDVSSQTSVAPTNVTSDGLIVKYDITSEVSISKVYGKTIMSYGDFYYAEVENNTASYEGTTFDASETIKNNVSQRAQEGKYDALTSATIATSSGRKTASYLNLIPDNIVSTVYMTQEGYDSFYPGSNVEKPNTFPTNATFVPVATAAEDNIIISAIKDINVSIDYDMIVNALALKELNKESELSASFLNSLNSIYELNTDNSAVGYVKPLLKDGTYGKRKVVNTSILNSTVKNSLATVKYEYNNKTHGEYISKIYVDGGALDSEGFSEYMNNLTAATVMNNRTGEKDGLFSIHNIWGVSGHGLYIEVDLPKTENAIHYDGKFDDLSVGANSDDYTITLMADGYEDVVVDNVNFDKIINGIVLEDTTFKVSEEKAEVTIDLGNVEEAFVQKLNTEANYTLTKRAGKTSNDCSSYLGEAKGNKVTIKDLKKLVEEYGDGTYTLAVTTKDYAPVSFEITLENDVTDETPSEENNGGTADNNSNSNTSTNGNTNISTDNNTSNISSNATTTKTSDTNSLLGISLITIISGAVLLLRNKLKSLVK